VTPLLEIDGISKRFGGLLALADISFNVFQGEILGLIGPNGAGKTTMFNCIAGVYKPTRGNLVFALDGQTRRINGFKPEKMTEMGIARTFQNIRLFNALTVLDNVRIARELGYLNVSDDVLVPIEQLDQLPYERAALVCTGSQGEPTSALVRMGQGGFRSVNIVPGDTVIVSATPIPDPRHPGCRRFRDAHRARHEAGDVHLQTFGGAGSRHAHRRGRPQGHP